VLYKRVKSAGISRLARMLGSQLGKLSTRCASRSRPTTSTLTWKNEQGHLVSLGMPRNLRDPLLADGFGGEDEGGLAGDWGGGEEGGEEEGR